MEEVSKIAFDFASCKAEWKEKLGYLGGGGGLDGDEW